MKGIIAWFARNGVAANLLMAVILAGGTLTLLDLPEEVFPEFSLDMVSVSVAYLGAAPEEVEEAVCVRIEEAVEGIDGIERVVSTAAEGVGTVLIELELGADAREVLDDVKARVDAIDTFPEETEKPVISEITNRRQVVDVAVFGDLDERSLKHLAERVRDDLTALDAITQVEIANARPYEISIEVSEADLRRHGLTLGQVAARVQASSLDLPGGSVKTAAGEILFRTEGQAYTGREFEELVLLSRPDGTHLRLGDVAEVVDGFADTDQFARFDGKPAMMVKVFRTGEQRALEVADAVHDYVERMRLELPEGAGITTWQDQSRILEDRLDLLVRNGRTGLLLVFLSLALFLRLRLAFWVSLGIPISFLGAFWLMPGFDVSVNLMSLFAFILVLGIVVDDAIVAGENIYSHQARHDDPLRGAIEGAQEISVPVVFAVLTTMAAFVPLLTVPGVIGKIMYTVPVIVISCLFFSLVESLLVLPAHLSHRPRRRGEDRRLWARLQGKVSAGLRWWIDNVYQPSLRVGLRWRYATVALGVATLVITLGLVSGGLIRFIFMPAVEADFVRVSLTMPQGTPAAVTGRAVAYLEQGAEEMRREIVERHGVDVYRHVYAAIGEQPFAEAQQAQFGDVRVQGSSSHLAEVMIELIPAEERGDVRSEWMANRWRELTGTVPDAVEVSFDASLFSAGDDIDVQFTGDDLARLQGAADALKARLGEYAGVYDIADSFREGKREVRLDIRPEAGTLGLSLADLARQVRQAFYGAEAQRIQRGRDEVKVMVRYPDDERRSLGNLEEMRIRTADGVEVPFGRVARVETGRGYAAIKRVDRQRAINVTAAVDTSVTTPGTINAEFEDDVVPALLADFPGVRYSFEGAAAEQRDTLGGLADGFSVALLAIFALLAVPLRSYVQPLIIMSAIPFGVVGAIWGHLIMGLDLTILSMFGVVALAGVVVNDSLVLVDFVNRRRRELGELIPAIRDAGSARFRPILLTSLTTFAGLSPMILETSLQAQFLIPMAVSLAFGVVFSTFVTLMLVPCGYLIVEDLRHLGHLLREKLAEARGRPAPPETLPGRRAETAVGVGDGTSESA